MQGKISLDRAEKTAEAVIARLRPYCSRIEIVGSIRRRRPRVNDIDLLIIPSIDLWGFHNEVLKLGEVKMSGAKLLRVMVGDIQVDINIADDTTWATLLLVKTGSAQHNIFLASLAKKKGWHLAASGDGLFNEKNERVAGESELSIFRALGISYKEPKDREVGGKM